MKFLVLILAVLSLGACSSMNDGGKSPKEGRGSYKVGAPYVIDGTTYYPQEDYSYDETGIASWYGPGFHAKTTANGETFDQDQLTAAHRTLPMPSLVRVTNLDNGKSIVARVNDRGPFARGRIIDLSRRGAELLGFKENGTAKVRVQILPEESMAIADAARQKGSYIAGTKGSPVPPEAEIAAQPTTKVQTVSLEPLDSVNVAPKTEVQSVEAKAVEKAEAKGRFLPTDEVVKQPITGVQTIYVQAGAFGVRDNAYRLAEQLKGAVVSEAEVGGRTFFRVRIPADDVTAADKILSRVMAMGQKNAKIVVDK